jgi:AcrR family transcriptional regulator
MVVLNQAAAPLEEETQETPERGPRARTRRLMLETAVEMMQAGAIPSVSEVAEKAEVSRATAYRYFPSQAALVQAVVDEALGPILEWSSPSKDPVERVRSLFATSLPRIDAFEATFRAALKHALEQWAKSRAGTLGAEPPFTRGHRIELIGEALAPLRGVLAVDAFDRLAKALSMAFGIEALIIVKDIWGGDGAATQDVATWAGEVLVRAALAEAGGAGR